MPSKKFEELNAMSQEELQNELKESESYLQKLKFDHAIRGLDNPMVLRGVRRDVARIHTILRQKEMAGISTEELANRTKIRNRRKRNK